MNNYLDLSEHGGDLGFGCCQGLNETFCIVRKDIPQANWRCANEQGTRSGSRLGKIPPNGVFDFVLPVASLSFSWIITMRSDLGTGGQLTSIDLERVRGILSIHHGKFSPLKAQPHTNFPKNH